MVTKIYKPDLNCSDSDGGDGGVKTFIELEDTPESYEGHAEKVVTVNPNEDGLIFTDADFGSDNPNNVFQVPADTLYKIKQGQELVNTGVFYADGEVHIDGKWVLLGETVPLTPQREGFGVGEDDHTHSELIVVAELQPTFIDGHYVQDVYHTLGSFPLLKILDEYGAEIHPIIKHISLGHFRIESNIAITGKAYALHSVQTRTPVLFGDLDLTLFAGNYTQILDHFADSFPFFKIMDTEGTELEVEIIHLTRFKTEIKSNIPIEGKIYML